jgi:hypothetical protein
VTYRRGGCEADEQARARQTASLAALATLLLLLVVGLSLVRVLHREAQIETCLLSGRSNCDALVAAMR